MRNFAFSASRIFLIVCLCGSAKLGNTKYMTDDVSFPVSFIFLLPHTSIVSFSAKFLDVGDAEAANVAAAFWRIVAGGVFHIDS